MQNRSIFSTKASFGIISLIFAYPHKAFHIRQLSKELDVSTTAIIEGVKILKDHNIITIEEGKVTKDIKADIESKNYRSYKIAFNLYKLANCNFINKLVEYFHNPECISIFGSFAKGEDIEESDIDILIVSTYEKPKTKEFEDIVKKFEKEINRTVNFHIQKSFSKSEDSFKNAVANGIVLHGYLKVI